MSIAEQTVTYQDGDTPLTGVLCRDGARRGQVPGLLLVHGADQRSFAAAREFLAGAFGAATRE
jgi:hypothetical protein